MNAPLHTAELTDRSAPGAAMSARPDRRWQTPPTSAASILVVEDDQPVRDALTEVLRGEGYQVIQAADATLAVARFVEWNPDLILLDLNLPGRDGWTALREMGRHRILTPVIVITARPHQYPAAIDAGIDAMMEKPLDLPVLLGAIARFLQETKPQRIQRVTRSGPITVDLSGPPTRGTPTSPGQRLEFPRGRWRGPLDE
jgi:DNA-binding response OmpR family regulator